MRKNFLFRIYTIQFFLLSVAAVSYTAPKTANPDTNSYFASIASNLKNDGVITLKNFKELVTAPSRFDTRDIAVAAIFTGTILLSISEDNSIQSFAQSHQSSDLVNLFRPGFYYGHRWTALAAGGGTYLLGLGLRNEWLHETGRETLTALVMSGLACGVIKFTVGRARPFKNLGSSKIKGFSFDDDYQSFPSGHATTAFAISTVLASRINNPIASFALYSLAFLTAAQRVHSNKHWVSDVMMGASIGTLAGRFVVHSSNRFIQNKKSGIMVIPEITSEKSGLLLIAEY